MAMRTILSDIAPFMGATHGVEIATYNSVEDMQEDNPHATFLYFVASEVLVSISIVHYLSGSRS